MSGAEGRDELVASLAEAIPRASDFEAACDVTMRSLLADTRFGRAALVLEGEEGLRAKGRNLPRGSVDALVDVLASDTETAPALRTDGFTAVPAGDQAPVPGLDPLGIVSYATEGGGAVGIALAADSPDDDVRFLAEVFASLVPLVRQSLEAAVLRGRAEQLSRERRRQERILGSIRDPVVLTDEDNNILQANDRAERLFTMDSGSEGRARAVRMNTFLFSSRLTEESLSEGGDAGRELTLVDPTDGSDLVFEVFISPQPESGDDGTGTISVLRDITELKTVVNELETEFKRARAAEHRARRESRRLNAILENAGEPIAVMNTRSEIILMNREAERLFGTAEDDTREPEARGLSEKGVRANLTKLSSLVSEAAMEQDRHRKSRLTLRDVSEGREVPFQAVCTKILDDHEDATAVVTVLRDLSLLREKELLADKLQDLNEELEDRVERATEELQERNRLLETQRRKLERASRMKSQFLANMSHELRTPVNAMLGYTSLVQEGIYGELTSDQEEALGRVESASEHLLEIIDDVLDLSKIEAGKMPIRSEKVEVEELLGEIVETVAPMTQEKSVDLRSEISPDLPVLVTDGTKLRQIVLNLMENAVKYTEEGHVAVRAAPVDGGESIRIEVEDTGIGIKEEHRERIFDDFRQVDESLSRKYSGTGLGLPISRKLVLLMGGAISVESEYGEGATFTVEIPRRLDPEALDREADRLLREASVDGEARG